MKLAALQTDIAWEDPQANFERLRPQIAGAAASGARMVVLPEMYACGFSMDTQAIAEPFEGPSVGFLREQARAHGLWMAASVPVLAPTEVGSASSPGAKPSNTFVLAGPAGEVHRYAKRHPFTFAKEHEHYAAGEDTLTVTIEGVRVSAFICYDLRFADEFWRLAHDTDLYVVVANWPQKRRMHWQTLLRARAIENQAWVVGVNRVGEGSGLAYSGDSMIIDPWGEVVAAASRDATTLLAEISAARVADARRKFPVLEDRRPPTR
ncbi:carbon-nitrogen hydrolase family protein [Plesiocystis pacifica SIR-1]|uniref:Carbon-nitrogen hydrolase family protein n=1 Tax=Plesiocystis pacifica SIR-1 TaxID=391625 RepID=A6GDG9_9BACT|nr:carbon-nitrogen family hydrolase [Plesiocystis pacifica]EDM76081.1 carbon-nitrogen hydrolase family protein [Plesiocystis pacifica SIR-1]